MILNVLFVIVVFAVLNASDSVSFQSFLAKEVPPRGREVATLLFVFLKVRLKWWGVDCTVNMTQK